MNLKLRLGLSTLAIIAILATGCEQKSATTAVPAAPAPVAETPAAPVSAPAEPAVAVITQDSPIWFDPEALSSCEGAIATVHWNASSFPGVKTAKVGIPNGDGTEGTFAFAASVGEKETGKWARGGAEFILRDGSTDAELARAVYPSLPCEKQ